MGSSVMVGEVDCLATRELRARRALDRLTAVAVEGRRLVAGVYAVDESLSVRVGEGTLDDDECPSGK